MNANFWRKWHRWVALPATLFLLFAAVTGVIVAFTEFFGAEEALREATRDLVSPVNPANFADWSARVLAAVGTVAAMDPNVPIDRITVQFKGPEPVISIFTGKPTGGEDRRFDIDANTGALKGVESYADKPLVHRIHSGEAFGDGGLVAAMFWGLALAILSVSGLFVYVTMWRRTRVGLRRWFW